MTNDEQSYVANEQSWAWCYQRDDVKFVVAVSRPLGPPHSRFFQLKILLPTVHGMLEEEDAHYVHPSYWGLSLATGSLLPDIRVRPKSGELLRLGCDHVRVLLFSLTHDLETVTDIAKGIIKDFMLFEDVARSREYQTQELGYALRERLRKERLSGAPRAGVQTGIFYSIEECFWGVDHE